MPGIAAASSATLLAAALLGAPTCVLAQSATAVQEKAIPATAPTQSVSDLPSARPAVLTQARASTGAGAVHWNGSALTIHAGGEDLPGILAQVAHATGLKVTGGVPDERVFGVYGPGPVQQVLADLFNGLYVNLLLVNGTATQPKELILTPRTGGPTPPSPPRSIEYEPPPTRSQRPYRGSSAPAGNFGPPQFQPAGTPPAGISISGANAEADPAAAADAGGQPQSPNGVRTPEQIFEELRKRQQGAQPGAAASQ